VPGRLIQHPVHCVDAARVSGVLSRSNVAWVALLSLALTALAVTVKLALDVEDLRTYAEHERRVEHQLGELNLHARSQTTLAWRVLAHPSDLPVLERRRAEDERLEAEALTEIRALDPGAGSLARTQTLGFRVARLNRAVDTVFAGVRRGDVAGAHSHAYGPLEERASSLIAYLSEHEADDLRKADAASASARAKNSWTMVTGALMLVLFAWLAYRMVWTRRRTTHEREVEAVERDVLERVAEELRHRAYHDALTALANRALLEERLASIADGEEPARAPALLLIDLDDFKAINDTHGHDAGDAVLEHFARVCRERVRVQDHVGRMGGEEFLLLLPEVRLNDAMRIIDRIREGFPPARPGTGRAELLCTFSAGVAEALPRDDRSSILYRSDRALYAKAEGRNCTRIGFEGKR
jgi:diguanylate cyclase (GGDEF)-like protein